MKTIFLAKIALTRIGEQAIIQAGFAKTQLIWSVTHHASIIKLANNKIISWALTHDKGIDKHKGSYEKIGYKGEMGTQSLTKSDFAGKSVEQHVSYPGVEWNKEYIEFIRSNNLDEFFIKNSKVCIMYVEKQMQLIEEGKMGLIKIASEHNELMTEAIKGIGS